MDTLPNRAERLILTAVALAVAMLAAAGIYGSVTAPGVAPVEWCTDGQTSVECP